MQQKNTLTNKDRLIYGGKVILTLMWGVVTAWTFSTAMTHGDTVEKVVAGLMLAFTGFAILRQIKKLWDEA